MFKNIICIFCTKESPTTDEHVIPEFAGGSLVIKEVCKACNDKMGSDFEGPLANSIFFRLARSHYEIQGKSESPINPFPHDGLTENGQKIKMSGKGELYSVVKIEENLQDPEKIELKLIVDETDKNEIPKIFEAKLRRAAKKHWPEMSSYEIDILVNKSLSSLPINFEVQTTPNPVIGYTEGFNFNHLYFLMMKIAYEIAFHHHGSKINSDSYYQQLRDAIYTRNVSSEIVGRLFPEPDPFLSIPALENSHCILLCRNICYIRLFKFSAIIQVIEEDSPHSLSQENWVIYWFNFVKKSCKKHNFLEYASGAIQQ